MATQRGEEPVTAGPEEEAWFTHPVPRAPLDDAASSNAVPAARAVASGAGSPYAPPGGTRAERRRAREAAEAAAAEGDTGRIPVITDSGPLPAVGSAPLPPPVGAAGSGPLHESGPLPQVHESGPFPRVRDSGPMPRVHESGPLPPVPASGPGPRGSGPYGPGGFAADAEQTGRIEPVVDDLRRTMEAAARRAAEEGETGRLDPVRDDLAGDPAGSYGDHGGAEGLVPEPRRGRRRRIDPDATQVGLEAAPGPAFDPGDTGTWRVQNVVPGADGGRRTTTILRYLLGLLAVDHVRSLTRPAFLLPVLGLILLLVHPRWIGLAVLVLGVLLIAGRIVAVRMIERRTLPRRYRPVEDDLRAAVEAGKANLRGELRRLGMPSSALSLPRSAVTLGSSESRASARNRLRDIEIDRVLPRAQLDRALRVLDEAPAGR